MLSKMIRYPIKFRKDLITSINYRIDLLMILAYCLKATSSFIGTYSITTGIYYRKKKKK